ncbi:MAG: nucleotidyltransferase domain-containing protein [Deltaproteobacteria bacterium]|jgi:predicted nucleotidyltransferase|nr:nucleotidyltransferase domain-containing protein [Deltaproteobacteria bacterium]
MIDIQVWMREAVTLLQREFGARLLFVGLQGSRRRGEAREDSDIDILTILDKLDVADLAAYRRVLRTLPEGEKACGFTCGREELLAWPPCELFAFAQDTDAYYGDLAALLPPVTRKDIVDGVRMAVSGLHHYTIYLYVSGEESARAEALKGVYKSFFFAMQVVEYLRSGLYSRSKGELLPRLAGDEAELLRLGMDAARYEEKQNNSPDALFQIMLAWTGKTMKELAK